MEKKGKKMTSCLIYYRIIASRPALAYCGRVGERKKKGKEAKNGRIEKINVEQEKKREPLEDRGQKVEDVRRRLFESVYQRCGERDTLQSVPHTTHHPLPKAGWYNIVASQREKSTSPV